VHHGDRLAQPRRLPREVAADLVGSQVPLGEQVAHARLGHGPAVGGVGGEVLEHPERDRLPAQHALDRALEAGYVDAADRLQRPVQLEVRVDPGQHPAEQLEDRLLAPRHRGVGLLDAEHATG
jgi:hypothetical protein